MKNLRTLIKEFQESLSLGISGKCGIDDEEIVAVADRLEGIDCGVGNNELRSVADKFKSLPDEKKAEIIYAIVEHRLYEEGICRKYGITRATMYRWMSKGKLPSVFHRDGEGKQYLFESECDKSLAEWAKTH